MSAFQVLPVADYLQCYLCMQK